MSTTLPAWPATLPLPDGDSYGMLPDFGLLRVVFDGGFRRQRQRVYHQPASIGFKFRMNLAQLGEFHLFLESYGFDWFGMELIQPAGWLTWHQRDCVYTRVRFNSDPAVEQVGANVYAVSISGYIDSMLDPRADPNEPHTRATVDDVTPELWDTVTDTDTLSIP